ncbi:Crp/Fnr family transcriptional regulator [Bradyrhizobium sp. 5.13L]
MLHRDAARRTVLSQGWLSQTPASFQDEVLARCLLKRFQQGASVYSIGDKPGGMFGLVAGGLGVTMAPQEQGPYVAHFAMPGTWFGEAAAFTRQPRMIGLTATRDSELFHLPLAAVDKIVKRDPSAWRYLGLVTLDHLRLALGGADDLMIRNHVKRFVAVLLRTAGCRLTTPPSQCPIEIDINHEDLAHMANVARTTAGAILRALESDGCVALSYRRIELLAPDRLRRMLRE